MNSPIKCDSPNPVVASRVLPPVSPAFQRPVAAPMTRARFCGGPPTGVTRSCRCRKTVSDPFSSLLPSPLKLLFVGAGLLLTGCFPVSESVYRPEASGGKLVETTHRYNSGPGRWDMVEFSDGAVKLQIRASDKIEAKENVLEINLTMIIPDGSHVQPLSDRFIFLREGDLPRTLRAVEIHTWVRDTSLKPRQVTETIESMAKSGEIQGSMGTYWIILTAPQPQRGPFYLEPPDLLIDGKTFRFPRIHFLPERTFYFFP